jgi:hypothetical protein
MTRFDAGIEWEAEFADNKQLLAQAGSNDYVKKPFSRAEVYNFLV